MRDEPYTSIDLIEVGPQQDIVEHKKPQMQDVPIDRKTKLDIGKLFEENKDV